MSSCWGGLDSVTCGLENHCMSYEVQFSENMRKIMRAVLTILGGLFFLGLSLHGAGSVFVAEWSSTS